MPIPDSERPLAWRRAKQAIHSLYLRKEEAMYKVRTKDAAFKQTYEAMEQGKIDSEIHQMVLRHHMLRHHLNRVGLPMLSHAEAHGTACDHEIGALLDVNDMLRELAERD